MAVWSLPPPSLTRSDLTARSSDVCLWQWRVDGNPVTLFQRNIRGERERFCLSCSVSRPGPGGLFLYRPGVHTSCIPYLTIPRAWPCMVVASYPPSLNTIRAGTWLLLICSSQTSRKTGETNYERYLSDCEYWLSQACTTSYELWLYWNNVKQISLCIQVYRYIYIYTCTHLSDF